MQNTSTSTTIILDDLVFNNIPPNEGSTKKRQIWPVVENDLDPTAGTTYPTRIVKMKYKLWTTSHVLFNDGDREAIMTHMALVVVKNRETPGNLRYPYPALTDVTVTILYNNTRLIMSDACQTSPTTPMKQEIESEDGFPITSGGSFFFKGRLATDLDAGTLTLNHDLDTDTVDVGADIAGTPTGVTPWDAVVDGLIEGTSITGTTTGNQVILDASPYATDPGVNNLNLTTNMIPWALEGPPAVKVMKGKTKRVINFQSGDSIWILMGGHAENEDTFFETGIRGTIYIEEECLE